MDRASIIAIEEVCKRCHLYTKHCGMSEYPSQCVDSGHFIDGYRKAEKDTIQRIREEVEKRKKENKWSETDSADERFSEDCYILSLLDELEKEE